MHAILVATAILLAATCLWGQQMLEPPSVQRAALGLPSGARADWRQWDSFLTFVVKKLGQDLGPPQRNQVGEVFLDSRYQLVRTFSSSDPVPRLLLDTWQRLSPILRQSIPGLSQQTANQYRSFITAMDGLTSAGGLGQRLGALRITPDALRGAASLLGPSTVDPLAYTLNVDSALRAFLGFTRPLPPRGAPPKRQSSLRKLPLPNDSQASALPSWFAESAFAAASDTSRLNQWVPETRDLQDYLIEIRKLLAQTSDSILSKSQLAQNQHQLYRQIVFTAAWQESCWRQFIKKGQKLTPLTSKTGDIGLMQVNRNIWRGLYDVKGLGDDIEYNGNAGGEILYYYLTRHALTKNEDKQAGGHLARATYAAYNGGPGHLSRYRAAKQRSDLKKIDSAFWEKFEAVSSGRELEVKRCFEQ